MAHFECDRLKVCVVAVKVVFWKGSALSKCFCGLFPTRTCELHLMDQWNIPSARVATREKSGDHRTYWDVSSGNYKCLWKIIKYLKYLSLTPKFGTNMGMTFFMNTAFMSSLRAFLRTVKTPHFTRQVCLLICFSWRFFQWARDQFEGLFKQTPENVNLFLR